LIDHSGGLRYSSTPGYFLSTLQVENSVDSSNILLPVRSLGSRTCPALLLSFIRRTCPARAGRPSAAS